MYQAKERRETISTDIISQKDIHLGRENQAKVCDMYCNFLMLNALGNLNHRNGEKIKIQLQK